MELYHYHTGHAPIIINVPHSGTYIPEVIKLRMVDDAHVMPDTDWFVDRLYAPIADALGAHMLVATHSRYVLDLNRSPEDESLYPERFTTGLCPEYFFDKAPLYHEGQGLAEGELAQRWNYYGAPYHAELQRLIDEVVRRHGFALLYDAHSIASCVPSLFDGTLPSFNVGTAVGLSCAPNVEAAVMDALQGQDAICNGRFKGGYITRHYGAPEKAVHAVQMELSQAAYMDEETASWQEDKADEVRPVLQAVIEEAAHSIES